jgi:hypothetical protein
MEAVGGEATKHYDLAEWVDFARGLTCPAKQAQMEEHLAGGCSHCRQLAKFCVSFQKVSATMLTTMLPEQLTSRTPAILNAVDPDESVSVAIPELIYEHLEAPSGAGLRTGSNTGWQALYKAGNYAVDLRVDPDPGTIRAVTMVGQLLNQSMPESMRDGNLVLLESGKRIVAQTRCNEFGEFHFNYLQRSRLRLAICLNKESKWLRIPIKHLALGMWSHNDAPNERRAL